MFPFSSFIAASSIFALSFSAPIPRSTAASARSLVERATYTIFAGDGTATAGWPSQADWLSFDDAWQANQELLAISCEQFGTENNSADENSALKSAIQDAAKQSGVPAEFILAIVMQESKGCVRVWTTANSHNNPGLMQSAGTHTCNTAMAGEAAQAQNPCPTDQIVGMINDGVGIGVENGLQQAIKESGKSDVSKFYTAARIYNSGSVPENGNLGYSGATNCYASDVANRLLGWTDMTSSSNRCNSGEIGSLAVSEDFTSNGNGKAQGSGNSNTQTSPEPQTSAAPTPTTPTTPYAPAASTPVATQLPTTQSPSTTEASSPTKEETPTTSTTPPAQSDTPSDAQDFPGASSGCKKWHTVVEGDTCNSIENTEGVDFETLKQLNNGLPEHQLNEQCTNLWKDYKYCIAA